LHGQPERGHPQVFVWYSKGFMGEEYIQPVNQNEDGSGGNKQVDDKPPIAPMDVGKIDSKENAQTSRGNHKKPKRKPLSWFEAWTIILGSFGILVAAGTGVAIYWQARISAQTLAEIEKGGKDTHELAVRAKNQADRTKDIADRSLSQADAANRLGTQAQRSADASEKSLAQARENFVKDQQPYIWAAPDDPQIKVGELVKWGIRFSNYGRSPAQEMRSCVKFLLGVHALSDAVPFTRDECEHLPGMHSITVIPAGFPGYTTLVSPAVVTAEDVNTINTTDGVLVAIGSFFYKDQSGHFYESTFCAYRLAAGGIAGCEKYNYIKRVN